MYDICKTLDCCCLELFHISSYHTNLYQNILVKQGVSPKDASYFVGRSYLSMVQDAERDCENPERFDALVEEQTPGGLNEQVSYLLEVLCISFPVVL